MKKIIIAGAGGAPSEGVIKSIKQCEKNELVIGMCSEPSDLALSTCDKKYIIPYASEPDYKEKLFKLIKLENPDLIHFQNDAEIFVASQMRDKIHERNVKTFMPTHDVIDNCVFKYKSYKIWKDAGINVPNKMMVNNVGDLKRAFDSLGNKDGKIWLRSISIGGGGKGALPTNNFEFAKSWIDNFDGWGDFSASELLTPNSVTWLSIWHEGELVVAQTRKRRGWTHGNRTLSGITGVTKVGETCTSEIVNSVALDSIKSIDKRPHGIYGVDMTYNDRGVPTPTEINISRFFTTILFFTEAGLNMPKIFKDIALYDEFPVLDKKINPLPDGLLWLRGMDRTPLLAKEEELNKSMVVL